MQFGTSGVTHPYFSGVLSISLSCNHGWNLDIGGPMIAWHAENIFI
jgi:hypothetical protein